MSLFTDIETHYDVVHARIRWVSFVTGTLRSAEGVPAAFRSRHGGFAKAQGETNENRERFFARYVCTQQLVNSIIIS